MLNQFHNVETRRVGQKHSRRGYTACVSSASCFFPCRIRFIPHRGRSAPSSSATDGFRFYCICWVRTHIKAVCGMRRTTNGRPYGFAQSSRQRTHTVRLPPRGGSCGSRWRRVRGGTHSTNPVVSQAPSTASGPPPSRREAFLEFAQTQKFYQTVGATVGRLFNKIETRRDGGSDGFLH